MLGFVSFFAGLIFAVGLGLGGMMQPEKVVGFLDVTGHWDPTLAFVMGSALVVYGLAYFLVGKRRSRSYLGEKMSIPTNKQITGRLIAGAAIFGAGWALIGYCPAPALSSMVTGQPGIFVFLLAMFGGMELYRQLEKWRERARDRRTAPSPAQAG